MSLFSPRIWLFALAPLTLGAAHANPLVIPGIGPEGAPQMQASTPDPAPVPARNGGGLGGGLLQLLLTGSTHSAPRYVGVETPAPSTLGAQYVAPQRVAAIAPAAETQMAAPGPEYQKQEVDYDGPEHAGTIVIDTPNKFLFLVEPDHRALRYGIGVGRPGFAWSGVKSVSRKAEWPDWTPPPEMLLRRPELPRHMDGGPENPLGARAMYLGSSMYRIHGTNEPEKIGQGVSSGCIRMRDIDAIDLYSRVKIGTKVLVI